jgi:UDP-glucose 4-epimerase
VAPRRAGDPPVLVASSRKARSELGWTPQGSLEVMQSSVPELCMTSNEPWVATSRAADRVEVPLRM